jgi:hypothetical protein
MEKAKTMRQTLLSNEIKQLVQHLPFAAGRRSTIDPVPNARVRCCAQGAGSAGEEFLSSIAAGHAFSTLERC